MQAWVACLFAVCLLVRVSGQQAVQFLPDDVPALASNITERLIFRASGLRMFWDDPYVRTARLQVDIALNNEAWRGTFNAAGGIAQLDPNNTGPTFRITSGLDDAINGSLPRPQLDFSGMPTAFHVQPGGVLSFDNVIISNIAPTFAYQHNPFAPWRNAGVGYPLWPSIVLSDNGTVVLRNVSVNYVDPSDIDSPEQYNAKVVFGLRQQYGAGNISVVNETAMQVHGPLTVRVLVLNGSTNGSSNASDVNATSVNAASNSTGVAYAVLENVTFNCEYWRNGTTAGLSPSAHAAAIAVPVVVGTLLLAGLSAWLCVRRRRKQRGARPRHLKDIEAGQRRSQELVDVRPARDQRQGNEGALYVAAGPGAAGGRTPGGSSSGGDSAQNASDNSAGSCGTHPSLHTPPVIALKGAAGMASASLESHDPAAATAGGAGSTSAAAQFAAAAGAAAAAAFPAGAPAGHEGYVAGSGGSSGGQYWGNTGGSSSRQQSCNSAGGASYSASAGMAETSSMETMGLDRVSTGRLTPGTLAQGLQHPLSSNRSFEYIASPGTLPSLNEGAAPVASRTAGTAEAVAAAADAAEAARNSAGSIHSTRSARSSTPRGPGASAGAASELGSLTSGSRALDCAAGGMSALIKRRSDVALLRDLKIGPLLGRGSYGRVYKGRWKAVTVAVKIIEHSGDSPGSASSSGKRISAGREMAVATNISHPNVVQTFHISTMTVAERNALAAAWLKEGGAGTSSSNSAAHMVAAAAARQASAMEDEQQSSSSNSSGGSDEEQSEALETWMVLEFCEKGTLQRAMSQGRFKRRDSAEPDMIGVYKALLDTAAGLDYLHSIGVVHGDLKTCNVLLKGSARDVRGFCCKIADFGLSRVLDMDATHVSTCTYGTIVYMPQELLIHGRMTTATDIYSFGLMMWELLTSQPVFEEGMSIGQMFYMIAYQNWRPTVPADCPPGYAQLMTACWQQDLERRPKVQQLLRSLQKLYVAEKQRIMAAKSAAGSPMRTSIDAGAAPNTRPTAVPAAAAAVAPTPAPAAPVPPVRTAAASPVAAAVTSQPSAATDWARAAAVAAAARAAFGTAVDKQRQGHQQQQQGQSASDRTSFESTGSDRYQNAASAASEPSMMVGGLPPWDYPGQLSQAPAAAAAAAAAATSSPATFSYGSSSTLPDTPAAAAAAAAARSRTGGESGPPSTVDTFPHSRRSFGSSRGSGNADGAGMHSEGTDGQEQYEPWAKVVSQDGAVYSVAGHGHGGHGVDRQRSMTLMDALAEGWPTPAAGTQQKDTQQQQQQQQQQRDVQQLRDQQQQQRQQRQQAQQLKLDEQQKLEEQQQQAQLELMIQQAFSGGAAPAATAVNSAGYSGYGGPQYSRMEMRDAADDTEPIEDTIPSESLFSDSNAVFRDAGEEIASGALYQDTAGFISGLHRHRSSKLMQHQIQQLQQQRAAVRPVGQAAQGFLDAIESVARPTSSSAAGGGAGASSSAGGAQGYELRYQQQQEEAHRFSVEFVPYMAAGALPPQQQQQQPQYGAQFLGSAGVAAAERGQIWAGSQQLAGVAGYSSGNSWGSSPSMAAYLQATTVAGSVGLAAQPLALQSSSAAVADSRLHATTAAVPEVTYAAAVPVSSAAGIPSSAAIASPFSAAQAAPQLAAAPATPTAVASPFAQAQPAAALPPVRSSAATSSSAAPQPGASPFAAAAAAAAARPARPPVAAATSAPRSLSPVSSGSGSSTGSGSSNIASPDRERVFMYRTPSGRVINPPFSMLQTVRESSGSSGHTSGRAESSFSGSGSKGSGPDSSRASSGPEQQQQQQQQLLLQAQAHSQLQRQQQQGARAAGPPPSPFAALAQRAGSLFGPT